MCEGLMLVIDVNHNTEAKTFEEWKKFASAESLALLKSTNGLEAFPRSQLKTMNPFFTTTLKKLKSRAKKGCLLAAYILGKTEKSIGFLKSGGVYLERNDPYHLFHVRETLLDGDVSAMFAARFEMNPDFSERWEPWADNVPGEGLFICTEPKPHQDPADEPSGAWRFRWFAEPYRPFHRMHFRADDDVDRAYVADDGERIDLFQTIKQIGILHKLPRVSRAKANTVGRNAMRNAIPDIGVRNKKTTRVMPDHPVIIQSNSNKYLFISSHSNTDSSTSSLTSSLPHTISKPSEPQNISTNLQSSSSDLRHGGIADV